MAKRGGTASGHADVIEEMRRITLALVVAVALAAPVAAQESVPAPERRGTIGAVILHFSSYENRHRLMRSCSITAASTDATSSAQGCLSSKRSGRRRATRAFMCTTTRQSIHGVALARRCASISQVQDASSLDYTSRTRTPSLGQIVVLLNTGGFYAALQVLGIKDDSRLDDRDEIRFRYAIQSDGSTGFAEFVDL